MFLVVTLPFDEVTILNTHRYTIGVYRNLLGSSFRLKTEQKLTVKFTHVHFLSIFKFDAKVKNIQIKDNSHTMSAYTYTKELRITGDE